MNCRHCGVILTHLKPEEAAFAHHHACPEHPAQKWERVKTLALMSATMDAGLRHDGLELELPELTHRAEILLLAIETGIDVSRKPCERSADIPELRNIVQILAMAIEMSLLDLSGVQGVGVTRGRLETASKAVRERLIPAIEQLENQEAVSPTR
jgi:hypothetical protein